MTLDRPDLALLGRWLRARVRIQLRNPRAVVFTLRLPARAARALQRAQRQRAPSPPWAPRAQVQFAQFYTPSIGIFSLTTACYTSLILGIATARDDGPAQARARHAAADGDLPGVVAGRRGADRHRRRGAAVRGRRPRLRREDLLDTLPAAIVTLVLGAACLSALGLAVATPREVGRPGDADRAADVPAAVVHLGHLVPARRRAGLAADDRQLLPARAHRPRVRRVLRARRGERRRGRATTCWRSRSGPPSACSSPPGASGSSRAPRARSGACGLSSPGSARPRPRPG